MKANDLLKLPWVKITDWSELCPTYYNEEHNNYLLRSSDFDNFLENIYHAISQKSTIPYKKVKSIIKRENKAFYRTKSKLFLSCHFGRNHQKILELENLFRIPDITQVEIPEDERLIQCLKLFVSLSDDAKSQFLTTIHAKQI